MLWKGEGGNEIVKTKTKKNQPTIWRNLKIKNFQSCFISGEYYEGRLCQPGNEPRWGGMAEGTWHASQLNNCEIKIHI